MKNKLKITKNNYKKFNNKKHNKNLDYKNCNMKLIIKKNSINNKLK